MLLGAGAPAAIAADGSVLAPDASPATGPALEPDAFGADPAPAATPAASSRPPAPSAPASSAPRSTPTTRVPAVRQVPVSPAPRVTVTAPARSTAPAAKPKPRLAAPARDQEASPPRSLPRDGRLAVASVPASLSLSDPPSRDLLLLAALALGTLVVASGGFVGLAWRVGRVTGWS